MAELHFSLHFWLVSFHLFIYSGLIYQAKSQTDFPVISSIRVFQYTQNSNKPVITAPEYLTGSTTTIIASTGWELELTCRQTNYPVEWVTNGYIGENKPIQVQETFKETIGIQISESNDFLSRLRYPLERLNTGPVTCRSIANSSIATEIFVFVKDSTRTPFIDSNLFINFNNVDPKIIPCAITDPILEVSLWTNGREVTDATYDPKIGFSLHNSSEKLNGHTVQCRVGDSHKLEHRITSSILKFEPKTENVAAFENSLIKLSCKSNKKITTRFPQDKTSQLHISATKINDYNVIITVQGKSGHNGTIMCDNGDQIRRWHFKIYETPKIYNELLLNDVRCTTTDNDNAQFTSLSCRNRNTCSINKECLQTGKCPEIFKKGISPDGTDIIIKVTPLSGLLQCSLHGAKYTREIFHGLDDKIYYDVNAGERAKALVQLDDVSPLLFSDEETLIVCNSLGYLFQRFAKFVVEYNNGTNKTLYYDEVREVEDDAFYEEREKPGVILYAGYVNLTKEAKRIHCLASWTNSSDWYDVYKDVKVVDAKKPTVKLSTKNLTLTLGSSTQLTCEVQGWPEPTVVWKTNATDFNTTKESKDGIVYFSIVFPTVNPTHQGGYICQASNRIGNAEEYLYVTTEEPKSLTQLQLYGIIIGSCVGFLFMLLVIIFIWIQYSRTRKLLRDLTDDEVRQFLEGSPELIKSFVHEHENVPYLPYSKQYEIPIKQLDLDHNHVLGTGAFGMIVHGTYKGMPVAVKMTKPNADVSYFKALLSELKIMIYVEKHPHIVSFIGSFTEHIKNRILYIIIELCPGGNLESRLRKYKDHLQTFEETNSPNNYANAPVELSNEEQKIYLKAIDWSRQVADGMEYLSSKRIIHGDLAARNVLLTADDVAKITDFGLSRQLYEYSFYSKKTQAPLPWRWMAIESLAELEFSTKSDVWSYGVTLWEMYSLGDLPFPGQAWTVDFVEIIHKGTRMKKPKYASTEIYELMCQCWSISPDRRPTFQEISDFFQQLADELPDRRYSNAKQ